jgi:tetratricopeptide (TPR) repeat protein
MRFAPLLGLSLSLTALPVPSLAATPKSQFCQTVQRDRAYGQWHRIYNWLNAEVKPATPVAKSLPLEITDLLKRAQSNPKETQLAIDRLTLAGFGNDKPTHPEPLLTLLDRTPIEQRSQFLGAIDQLVITANALPSGYNSAQSRALIAAAHAYQKLGQPIARATPLLQKASQTAAGVGIPVLRSTVQWRLAQAQAAWGQTTAETIALEQAAQSFQSRPRQPSESIGSLVDQLVDRLLAQQKRDQALAVANSINIQDEGFRQLVKIAIADQRANQPQRAAEQFNTAFQQLLKAPQPGGGDWTFNGSEGMIAFAQAGGLSPVAAVAPKIPATLPHISARVWLTIAGTARQTNQPEPAAAALTQFIAAGKAGKAQGFSMGFGDQRDYEWSQSLFKLTRDRSYAPEMTQFLNELGLRSAGAEFLITEAIKAKQFDAAKQLIPIPMSRGIDAGVFEVQNRWLLKVAAAAAAAGKPQQLQDHSQNLLTSISQTNQSDMLLVNDVQQLVIALKKYNQTALIPPLVAQLVRHGELILAQPVERWMNAEEIAINLQSNGYSVDAAKIRKTLAQRFLAIGDRNARFLQLQNLHPWSSPPIDDLVAFGKQIQMDDHPDFAALIYRKAAALQKFDKMEQWAAIAAKTPIAKLQIFSTIGEIFLNRNQPEKALVWYDRALAAAPDVQLSPKNSEPSFQALINGYIYFAKFEKAKQAAQSIVNPADKKAAIAQLSCF